MGEKGLRIYFITKRKFAQRIIWGLLIILGCAILINYIQRNLTVPTTEISPIYQGNSGQQVMSFAINVDWGEEYLPQMLKTMDQQNIKCTFFLTGRWTEKFPEIAKLIADQGHEIGNHGYKHDSPNQMSVGKIQDDIQKSAQIIKKITGRDTLLYAPPSGERDDHVVKAAHELGYRTVLWSIDTIDWKRPSTNVIVAKILDKAHNGAIVLMHPTEPTMQALPIVIPQLTNQGYRLVTISDNIKPK